MLDRIGRVPKSNPIELGRPPAPNGHHPQSSGSVTSPSTAMAAGAPSSVIGSDLRIIGEDITVVSENNLQIDGQIRGNVIGKEVVIGPQGSVAGTVSAERVEIFGGVEGSIYSIGLTLHDTAQVDGEIIHETLVVKVGAYFEGKVRRLTDRNELQARLDPSSYMPTKQ